jgi:outer membrane protein OmpA-like peptidoglycan-associated protein
MSKKFRLFASVAAPLVSLPLMMQPAGAAPPRPAIEAGSMPGVVQVQQQVIVPPAGQSSDAATQDPGQAEGKQRPRRQQQEGQGEAGQQRAPQSAQAPDGQQPEQRPRRQQQAEPQTEPQAAPREAAPRQAQPAEQPAAEAPAPRPQRQQQADQNKGDAQPKPRRDAQSPQAAPDADKPASAETKPTAPEGNGGQQRRNAEAPAAGKNTGAAQDAAPLKPASDTQNTQARPAPVQPTQTQATPESQPQGQQPGAQQRRQTPEGQPTPPVAGQPAPGQANQGQPALAPQPTQAQPATQPTSPQQVQRAREVAKDPASAKAGEQVVLPVENGAAVLDSAKEAPAAPGAVPAAGQGAAPRAQQPQQADQRQVAPPKSDADAQSGTRATREQQAEIRALGEERGQRLDRRPDFERPGGWEFRDGDAGRNRNNDRDEGRVIISIDNQTVVRHDDSRRFYDEGGRQPEYERLGNDRVREVIIRDDGTRIITVRNRYGEIVQRSRVVRGGEEYVLYSAPDLMDNRRDRNYVWRDPGADLPPMRLSVPLDDYIIDTSSEPDRDYYEFLEQPPVEQVERVYSLDEVRYSARIRDKVPRIDLDTITFATGSAEIPMNQASSLRKVADAIAKVLKRDPSETFLIEGHTDAVGSDDSNLVLSDQRAESVARVMTDAFGIAPENLTTQGYGERYLKVRTDGPEQQNRRVTIRRITSLVKPVASK